MDNVKVITNLRAIATIILVVGAGIIIFYHANELYQERLIYNKLTFVKVGKPLTINITLAEGEEGRLEIVNHNLTRDLVVCIRKGENATVYSLFVLEYPECSEWYPSFLGREEEYMEELEEKIISREHIHEIIVDGINIGKPYSIHLDGGRSSITISPLREGTLVKVKVFKRLINTKTYLGILVWLVGIVIITALFTSSLAYAIGTITLSSVVNWTVISILASYFLSLTVGVVLLLVPSVALLIESTLLSKKEKRD